MKPRPHDSVPVSTPARPELGSADWRRLNRLLAQALELDPDRRSTWMDTLPDADRDLAPVLADLLARAEASEANRSLTQPTTGALRHVLTATGAPPRDETPGDQIGPYRLLRELGVGGMGTVWLAERTDGTFRRQVALKLPRAEWTDRGLAERMARERTVLASLSHPNIAQMYDAGWASDGRPYLALEYVDGVPIDAWCKSRALTPAARVRLFVDVVRAVAFAHTKLVIHRDLKPSNVLVDTDGRVKMLDFGIAKLLLSDKTLTEETALTRVSGRALTLNYAAPEQVLGQPMSTAADTYSLGVMLFELLTGERPYRLARDSRGALEEAIVSADPPLPSSVATDKADSRALRGDLDAIILKALSKQPEQRYETAAAFADDLERWLDQRPVRAQRSSGWYRTRRFLARHRLAVMAGTLTTCALLIGGGLALWQFRAAGEETARADSVRDFVLSIIAQADPTTDGQTREADLTLLTTAEARIANELAGRPALALEMRLAIAKAYRNRGEFTRARTTLRSAIDAARAALPRSDPALMQAWVLIADWPMIDRDEVVKEIDATIVQARKLGTKGTRLLVEGLIQRSGLAQTLAGSPAAAEADIREAYAIAVRELGPGDLLTLRAVTRMEPLSIPLAEKLPLVEAAYRAAVANPELAPAHPLRTQLQSQLGVLLCIAGRGREGLDLLRESERLARESHSGSLPAEYGLAGLRVGLAVTGDVRGALAVAQETLALAAAREPPGAPNRGTRANMTLWAAYDSRRIEDAPRLLSEMEAHLATLPEGDRRVWVSRFLAMWKLRLMNLAGDTAGAERLAEELSGGHDAPAMPPIYSRTVALDWSYALRQNNKAQRAEEVIAAGFDPRLGEYNEDWDFLAERAAVRLALDDPAAALDFAERALVQFQRIRLQVDPAMADLYVTHGRALLGLDRPAEALESLRKAHEFWQAYDAPSRWAAEAMHWYGKGLIARGDTKIGQPMLMSAQARLAKSPTPAQRALAAATLPAR